MARTSFSWKRIAMPLRLARMMSCVPSVIDGLDQLVALLEQSMALMPALRGLP